MRRMRPPVKSTKRVANSKLPTVSELREKLKRLEDYETWSHDGRQYARVSPRLRCPQCGETSWCFFAVDGRHIYCHKADIDAGEPTEDGDHVRIALLNDVKQQCLVPARISGVKRVVAKATVAITKPQYQQRTALSEKFERAMTPNFRRELALRLGVSTRSLILLSVGYAPELNANTIPEKDHLGNVVGINRRFILDQTFGSKLVKQAMMHKHKRGLYYAANWAGYAGDLYVPEGFTCTAAGLTMGLRVIGRPNNRSGGMEIAALLKASNEATANIIVIAENDQKSDGRWPGREGAECTAKTLATQLQQRVAFAFAGNHKDVRHYLNSAAGMDVQGQDIPAIRRGFERLIQENLTWVEPGRHHALKAPPDEVPLHHWRHEQQQARASHRNRPGIYLDRSQPGTGKSEFDNREVRQAVRRGERVAIVVPTHRNARELANDLREKHAVNAALFPELSEKTCRRYAEAKDCISQLGLNLGSALCGSCGFCQNCAYRNGVQRANKFPVVISTHKRLETDSNLLVGRKYIAIHESCDNAIARQYLFSRQEMATVVASLENSAEWRPVNTDPRRMANSASLRKNRETRKVIRCLAGLGQDIVQRRIKPNEVGKPLEVSLELPAKRGYWQKQIYRSLKEANWFNGDSERRPPNRNALRGLIAVALQSATLRYLSWDSNGKPYRRFLVQEFLDLPSDATIWLGDATNTAARLERIAQRNVVDLTPAGRVPLQHDATIVPRDITRGMQSKSAANYLRAILLLYRPQRLGVIGHQNHVRDISDPAANLLGDELRAMVHKWAYFGGGDERASNDWLDCDLIVVLGTHRLPEPAIRLRLLQQRQYDTAAITPIWKEYSHDELDVDGIRCTVTSRAYENALWHQESLHQIRESLLQAIGRGRSILSEGVPVIGFSNAHLPEFAIAPDHPVGRQRKSVLDAIEAVMLLTQDHESARVKDVALLLDQNKGNVSKALSVAKDEGFLDRAGRGRYRLAANRGANLLADRKGGSCKSV